MPGVCLYQEQGSGAAVPYWRMYRKEACAEGLYGAVLYCGSTGRRHVQGLSLNIPPKPKQAKGYESHERRNKKLRGNCG